MTVIVNTDGDPKTSMTFVGPIQHTEAGATYDVVNEVIEAVLAGTVHKAIQAFWHYSIPNPGPVIACRFNHIHPFMCPFCIHSATPAMAINEEDAGSQNEYNPLS